MRRKISALIVVVLLFFVLVFPKNSFSHHQGQVLGESTTSSQVVFPPVSAGAGFFLPDSPLYFLDNTFQGIRLFLAFTPERKAEVRREISGERLAELRIMLARDNSRGIQIALSNLANEVDEMSSDLSEAAASGKDVSALAKNLNDTVKAYREILKDLEGQTGGVLGLQLKTARESLKLSKIEIEDKLSEEDLAHEIEDALDEEIEEAAEEASGSAKRLQHAIDILNMLASQAAERNQTKRQEALLHAIEVKDEALQKQLEKFGAEEIESEELLEARARAIEDAKEAIEKSQEAAHKVKEAHGVVIEAKRGRGNSQAPQNSNSPIFEEEVEIEVDEVVPEGHNSQ